MPGVATKDAIDNFKKRFEKGIFLKRFDRIVRAAGVKAAAGTDKRADDEFVKAYE